MELTKVCLLGEGGKDFFGDIFTVFSSPVRKEGNEFLYDITVEIDPIFSRICNAVTRVLESYFWETD